jgi:hypothetical protein
MKPNVSSVPLLGVVAFAGAVAVGCVAGPPPGTVYASFAPPVAQVEVVGVAPAAGYVWVAGHHVWHDSAYHWQGGRWVEPPHAHAQWVAGSWNHHTNGWYWHDGHWK